VSLIFLGANHAPDASNVVAAAGHLVPRKDLVIPGDTRVDLAAQLAEHSMEVGGLASISGVDLGLDHALGHRDNVADTLRLRDDYPKLYVASITRCRCGTFGSRLPGS
jgi:hypothetical protein